MKKTLALLLPMMIVLSLAGGALAGAQDKPKPAADPISGSWEGTVELPDGSMPFTMTLKLDGALGGSLSYGGGQMVVTWAAKKKVDK
jgi:hypothetical protein